MSKRLPEGPPAVIDLTGEPDKPQMSPKDVEELLAMFAPVFACLQGADRTTMAHMLDSMPYTIERLRDLWRDLVTQKPRAAFDIAVEAFSHVPDDLYSTWESFNDAGISYAAFEEAPPPGGKLLMPELRFRDPRPATPPLPLCTMHGLTEAQHLALATATAAGLAGDQPWPTAKATFSWLQTAVLVHMRHHQLCLIAHELLSQALFEGNQAFVERLLEAAPDSFFVDVLVYEPAARGYAFVAPGLDERRDRLWAETAQELVSVRPAVQAAIRASRIPLHAYQKAVVRWAAERERLPPVEGQRFRGGEVVLLPGMGKTRIALALVSVGQQDPATRGTTLVFSPLAVINDWLGENQKTGAGLTMRVLHGDYDGVSGFSRWVDEGVDVIVTTTQTFDKSMWSGNEAARARIRRVIIDEVHLLSNPQTKIYKRLEVLLAPVPCRWGLSGSPHRNQRADIMAQLLLLGMPYPGYGDEAYKKLPEHMYQLEYGPETVTRGPRSLEKIEVPLAPLEWDLYKQIYQYGKQLRDSGAKFARIQAAMMRMRQAALSLELVPLELLETMRKEAIEEMDRQSGVILGWFAKISRSVGIAQTPFQVTIGPGYMSARFAAVIAKLDEIVAAFPNDKMLVFCSLTQAFALLAKHLREGPARPWTYGIYDGSATTKQRQELRAKFDTDPKMKALFITYGAGAAGMNLQVATHVLEIDPCFNDATLDQAEARAWRIREGPPRLVRVYRFTAPGTYEDRMEEIRARKRADWADFRGVDVAEMDKEDKPPENFMDAFFA